MSQREVVNGGEVGEVGGALLGGEGGGKVCSMVFSLLHGNSKVT
jgi:hypothetical protein